MKRIVSSKKVSTVRTRWVPPIAIPAGAFFERGVFRYLTDKVTLTVFIEEEGIHIIGVHGGESGKVVFIPAKLIRKHLKRSKMMRGER